MIIYKGTLRQVAQKIFKSKIEASPVNASHYSSTLLSKITFYLRPIWLQTSVAIDSKSCQTWLCPSFCMPPSEISVLFDQDLSRRPFLGQVVNLDLMLCTGFNLEHAILFLFTQRPMNDWKIEQSTGTALVGNSFWPIPSKISFCLKKEVSCCSQTFTKHWNLFDSRTESVLPER